MSKNKKTKAVLPEVQERLPFEQVLGSVGHLQAAQGEV